MGFMGARASWSARPCSKACTKHGAHRHTRDNFEVKRAIQKRGGVWSRQPVHCNLRHKPPDLTGSCMTGVGQRGSSIW
eukprot:616728-Pelagomonas_calceolata.AAC.3